VKLVVIDSIAFPFRQDQQGQDSAQRSRQLSSLSQDLYRNALQKRVAVVVVNHVTTKVFRGNETAEPVGHVLGRNGSQV
jgi:RecA/RadA recombinase